MNRRKAIGGILGITGITVVSAIGAKYLLPKSYQAKRDLRVHSGLIAELVDVIIPATESPGAKSAVVQDYIINYMEDCSSAKEYNNFLNGLNDLQEDCVNNYSKIFEQCSSAQKSRLLENLDNNWSSKGLLSKINNKLRGRSFINMLKTLTIEGYCTSSIGATKHLKYLPIPGVYKAITNLKPGQKAWATK